MPIATISIIVSICAFSISVINWRERRAVDKRDLFLKVHERLLDLDLQHGRRILTREVKSREDVRLLIDKRYADYEVVSRSLSMLDFAALYAEKNYLDRKLFIQEWGYVYAELKRYFDILISERTNEDPAYAQSWPHFQSFAREMVEAQSQPP